MEATQLYRKAVKETDPVCTTVTPQEKNAEGNTEIKIGVERKRRQVFSSWTLYHCHDAGRGKSKLTLFTYANVYVKSLRYKYRGSF